MKTLRLAYAVFVLLAFVGTEACGQQTNTKGASDQRPIPAVALKVKREQNTSRKFSDQAMSVQKQSTASGTERRTSVTTTKDSVSSMSLDIEVRNISNTPATVELKWYFVATPADGGKPWVFDSGGKTLELPVQGAVAREKVASQKLTATTKTRDAVRQSETGSKASGYIVLVQAGDKILKVDASSKPLEEAGRSPEELKALLSGTDATAKKKH